MISGECRVEGIPSSDGPPPSHRKLAIEGIRLKLDLRIVPGTAGDDPTAAAVWRIESENVALLPMLAPAALRRAVAATALALAAVASIGLGLWWVRSSERPSSSGATVQPSPAPLVAPPERMRERPAPPPAAARRSEETPRPAPADAAGVAPRIAIVPADPGSALTATPPVSAPAAGAPSAAAPSTNALPPAAPVRVNPTPAPAAHAPIESNASAPVVRQSIPPSAPRSAAPAASPPASREESTRQGPGVTPTSRDMLDLFSDTK